MKLLTVLLMSVISLCGEWQFRQTSPEGEWLVGTVPGCVHTDLLHEGMIPDPFFGNNEKRLQWIGEKDWEYQREFQVKSEDLDCSHMELILEGVDTYARVYINKVEVLRTDNMFRTWRINVKPWLKEGINTISVKFESVFKTDIPKYLAAPYKLQAWPNNDQSDLWISLYARKAGYNYGWDWGPRLITTGLWKPVKIECWNNLLIKPSQIITKKIDRRIAEMQACVNVMSDAEGPSSIEIRSEGRLLYKQTHNLRAGENRIVCPFQVRNPELWWTKDLGGQKIYDFEIIVAKDEQTSSRVERTGIRTIEVRRESDDNGRSFSIELNGVPVFMKGADWIPQDNFPARITPERYKQAVADATRANMNMLRVWGGGLYESDDFYQACDEAGILVWQDMAFACGMFPSDSAYTENVRAEVRDNVSRLRNHPSLALWCGNNENEISYFEWGWNRTLSETQRQDYEASLHKLFYEMIPKAIAAEDSSRYYHPGSPSTGFNGIAYSDGDAHYWGVWKGAWVEEYLKPQNIARFMSEYGFQSYPELRTIERFTDEWDREIGSVVMLAHQRAYDDNTRDPNFGDNMSRRYMRHYYCEPEVFADYIYLSQYQQAEAVKVAMEAHRRAKPYCMGTLFWQINDCWPVASWSSVDYYGRWKPLQFYAKRAYAELLASPYLDGDDVKVRIVSDSRHSFHGSLEISVMDFEGNISKQYRSEVRLAADAVEDVASLGTDEIGANEFLFVRLLDGERIVSENTWLPKLPNQYTYAEARPQFSAKPSAEGVELTIATNSLIRGLMIYSANENDVFDDNCIDVIPGFAKTVLVETATSAEDFLNKISYSSLNNIMK